MDYDSARRPKDHPRAVEVATRWIESGYVCCYDGFYSMGKLRFPCCRSRHLFSAPEILTQLRFDFKVDIWSVGVIMFNMLQGSGPFPGNTIDELKNMVCNSKTLLSSG